MPTRQTADYDPLMDELPPELAAEYMAEKRRRKISEALMGQSQEPLVAPEVKGRFQGAISPFQGLAKIAQAYMANKGLEGSDAAMAGIGGRVEEGRNAAIQKMTQAMTGTPQESLPADVYGPPKPAMPGDMDAAMQIGMQSPYTKKIAEALLMEKMKSQPQMAFKAEEAKLMRDQRMRELEMRLEDQRLSRADRDSLQRDLAQMRIDAAKEMKSMVGAIGRAQPYFSPFDSSQGAMVFDHRTGKMVPAIVDGKPLTKASSDPVLQGDLASAKKEGAEVGEAAGGAKVALTGAEGVSTAAIKQIDDLLEHPGFKSSVGWTWRPQFKRIHGTPEADFFSRLDQAKGGAFLTAFETLKGGGQITEIEGKKATDAITRMSEASSENEFRTAAKEYKDAIARGFEKLKKQSAMGQARRASDKPGAVRTVDW